MTKEEKGADREKTMANSIETMILPENAQDPKGAVRVTATHSDMTDRTTIHIEVDPLLFTLKSKMPPTLRALSAQGRSFGIKLWADYIHALLYWADSDGREPYQRAQMEGKG